MSRKDETQMAKAAARKAVRAAIRLKYSLLGDAEINRELPEVEDAIDRAISAGKPYELDVRSVFEDVS